jgi:hypothetical protein
MFGGILRSNSRGFYLPEGYLGFLDNLSGYTLGCAVVDPSRLAVSTHGDGSCEFHIVELGYILET